MRALYQRIENAVKYAPPFARPYFARKLWIHLRKAEPELRYLPHLIKPGTVGLDIGANKGMYAGLMAKKGMHVHAFEPIPTLAKRLKNALPRSVTVHQIALSNENGTANLMLPERTDQRDGFVYASLRTDIEKNTGFTIPVKTRTLDSYEFKNLSLIKIDVEGFELTVLQGARQTIANNKPILILELEERHTNRKIMDLIAEVESYGYQTFFLQNDTLTPISQFDPAIHHNPDQSPYINNFIFKPNLL